MNLDLIILNETFNNGCSIFFYQEELTGVWVSYGYSAFLLSQIKELNTISGFSQKMQMPCVCMANVDFHRLVTNNLKTIECKEGYYRLPTSSTVDENAYQQWTTNLK